MIEYNLNATVNHLHNIAHTAQPRPLGYITFSKRPLRNDIINPRYPTNILKLYMASSSQSI